MQRHSILLAAAVLAALPLNAPAASAAELANLKVVTDANPDYSDLESMVHSITGNWSADKDKMFALFYWDHIARRQTAPMIVHGFALTDPIRQFNDYGYTMCSTISGTKCSTWNYMGYPCRYFDISNHTVCDVWYDGKFHHYDNSLSMMYTLPDGKTIAAVPDIGAKMAGPETNGQEVQGYLALYHALTCTSANGFCQGADDARPLEQVVHDFTPSALKYRSYFYDQDRGHRYILNLRDGEVYTRYYSRQDASSPDAVLQAPKDQPGYKADPAYYVPNDGHDPETANPRYHIRGNGERTWTPILDDAHLASELYSSSNLKSTGAGLAAADPSKPAEAIFKVEGSNVITSLKIRAAESGVPPTIAISTTNGLNWKDLPKPATQDSPLKTQDLKLIDEVNGAYEVLVKVTLNVAPPPSADVAPPSSADVAPPPSADVAQPPSAVSVLQSIAFDTLTEINAHTQPTLHLGKNTVYVGNGPQTESIVFWPALMNNLYKPYAVDEKNLTSQKENEGYYGTLYPAKAGEDGYVVFKIDAPTGGGDITSVTYGGRLYNRSPKAHIDFLHSFDGGQTWKQDYSLTDTKAPWDVVHYETLTDIPADAHSVLFKYLLNGGAYSEGGAGCSLYAVRMEVNHKLVPPSAVSNVAQPPSAVSNVAQPPSAASNVAQPPSAVSNVAQPPSAVSNVAQPPSAVSPVEVTFNWQERQKDYTTIKRSHTQLVDKLPATYTIDVGGDDQPIVDSLTVNLKGSRNAGVSPASSPVVVKPGYSDGKDVGGQKWVGTWATYGNNLALHKPYTVSVPSETQWRAGDPDGKKLTDGIVGSDYTGGNNYTYGPLWKPNANPEITVDLGAVEKCAAFRIHTLGWEPWDAMKGQNQDQIEVLTSNDGKDFKSVGFFDCNLRWKDIPVNFMFNDDETFCAFNFFFAPPGGGPVNARFIKYKITSARMVGCSEVQVLDSYKFEPYDLKIALPDPAQNGLAPPKADLSPNAKKWAPADLPTTVGKEQHWK